MKNIPIGQILVENGFLKEDQLEEALENSAVSRVKARRRIARAGLCFRNTACAGTVYPS